MDFSNNNQLTLLNTAVLNQKSLISLFLICSFLLMLWPCSSSAATARDKYFKAEACYNKLRKSSKKQKYRHNWLTCIKKFQAVYSHNPSGPWAAAGLYMSGKLYQELYSLSFKKSDKKEALDIFERIIKRFPRSRYCRKAAYCISSFSKTIPKKTNKQKTIPKKIVAKKRECAKKKSNPDPSPVEENVKLSSKKNSTFTGLRFWSNPNYTRIVIDTDKETTFTHRLLKKDPSINKPQRLFVDLSNCRLGKDTKKIIPINDDLLSDARAGQHTPDSIRVVVDIKSFKTYKIFSLKNPFRIVMDVWGSAPKTTYANLSISKNIQKTSEKDKKIAASAIAKQLALGVSTVVIDPGHGGRDPGALGYLKGVYEKDVVLKISKKLARKIREKLNCEVIMTRTDDQYLTLEERTAIANTKNADLFISIHANAGKDKKASGIETYFLNLATDDEAILVAARENATSTKNISDLQTILYDLMRNAKINESSRLAGHVQETLHKRMKKKYSWIKNKGVKQAPFYVLLGAQMPAILIETSFISNPKECKRLTSSKYQDALCDSIVRGIGKYIRETNPTAFLKTPPETGSKG